jgi:putative ABC transport system substrate-binding protein
VVDRRTCIAALTGCILGLPPIVDAQVAGKTYRICGLQSAPPATPDSARLWQAFQLALGERGFVEGRNVVFERRYIEGRVERIPALAAELVRLNCDVITVTVGDLAVRTLKELTSTIPIVMFGASDPVRDGLVASLARPGGNITGVTDTSLDLIPKQLELLKTAAPGVRRVVYLYGSFGAGDEKTFEERMRNREAAAKALGVDLIRIQMPAPQDFASASAAVLRERADALLISPNSTNFILRNEISEFALRHRLPVVAATRELAAAGVLLSYGNNLAWVFRKSAEYVDKILRGAKPADLPIEQSTFELVLNLKTAKALGLTLPQSLLLRADEVMQ